MYRIGIIGCGKIAQVRHIPEYLANEKAKICAVYDINQERAKEIASALSLSVNTVNNHIANIFSKTGVRSRIDLLNLIHKSLWLENGK